MWRSFKIKCHTIPPSKIVNMKKNHPPPRPNWKNHQSNPYHQNKNLPKTKRGPRTTKHKSRYKRRKQNHQIFTRFEVFTRDNSVVCFYSHPVDGNNDESALFATTAALIGAFKTIRLNQSIALERPDSSIVQDVPLLICYSWQHLVNLSRKLKEYLKKNKWGKLLQDVLRDVQFEIRQRFWLTLDRLPNKIMQILGTCFLSGFCDRWCQKHGWFLLS